MRMTARARLFRRTKRLSPVGTHPEDRYWPLTSRAERPEGLSDIRARQRAICIWRTRREMIQNAAEPSLEPRIFHLGLLKDRGVVFGTVPKCKEFLVRSATLSFFTLESVGTRQAEMR